MSNEPSCGDCYFKDHGLCALALERPCPTFRPAGRTLEPPRQPTLVPRAAPIVTTAAGTPAAAYAA